MAVTIRIPTPLRKLTNEQEIVEVEPTTVGAAIDELEGKFPGIKERLIGEDGEVRRFVNVCVRDEDVRCLDGLDTAVPEGCTVAIVPAVAGGCPDLRPTPKAVDDGRTGPAHVGKLLIRWLD